MKIIELGFIACCLASTIACSASKAAEVTVQFSGIVDHVSGPGAKQFRSGELVTGSYKLETSVPDLAPADPNKGQYQHALKATTINFAGSGFSFSHEWGPGLFADVSVTKKLASASASNDDVSISAWRRTSGSLLDGKAPCCVEIVFSAVKTPCAGPPMLANDSIPTHPLAYTYANVLLNTDAGWTTIFIKPVPSPEFTGEARCPDVASAPADEVTVEFSGIVEAASGKHANQFRKGERVTGFYKLNAVVPDIAPKNPNEGQYSGSLISTTVNFPRSALTFSHGLGVGVVDVSVFKTRTLSNQIRDEVSIAGWHRTGGSLLGDESPCCMELGFFATTPPGPPMLANDSIPTKPLAFMSGHILLRTRSGWTSIDFKPDSVAKP